MWEQNLTEAVEIVLPAKSLFQLSRKNRVSDKGSTQIQNDGADRDLQRFDVVFNEELPPPESPQFAYQK
jgi:hypothetical protein